jgi:tetratricopeptide (TPR) repeat protein
VVPLTKLKLTWSLALLALPLGAQSRDQHYEQPLTNGLGTNSVPLVIDRSTVHQAPARTIPAELLRYPLSAKALHMLQRALQISESGDHAGAVKQLQKTLAKCPGSAAYADSLIGVEYLKTAQIPEAIHALEQAVKLLPHDASNHANLGLSLLIAKHYDRAQPELRRALELDPHNAVASQLLSALASGETASK